MMNNLKTTLNLKDKIEALTTIAALTAAGYATFFLVWTFITWIE